MKPRFERAQVLGRSQDEWNNWGLNTWQQRTLHALRKCRTAALGGHIDQCDHPTCRKLHLSYNSCRNRHCPKCQHQQREAWIEAREADLLDVPYYHLVFTLPSEWNGLCLQKPRETYGLLFQTVWSVVRDFGDNPKWLGARRGMIAIVHTWGQNLGLHPHLHCMVPGGGTSPKGKWKKAKGRGKYLFPVKALSQVFRARFVAGLRKEIQEAEAFYQGLFAKDWVVYCKRPFAGPKQVVEYLGRYTHKVAISNHRIEAIQAKTVSFRAKDYRKEGKVYTLRLNDQEFVRRFAQHILPKGFVRIRHYGFLSGRNRKKQIARIREQMPKKSSPPKKEKSLHRICPTCQKGKLLTVCTFDSRGPPPHWRIRPRLNQ